MSRYRVTVSYPLEIEAANEEEARGLATNKLYEQGVDVIEPLTTSSSGEGDWRWHYLTRVEALPPVQDGGEARHIDD
jgi:hypothetical protein